MKKIPPRSPHPSLSLTAFVTDLLTTGEVTLAIDLAPFTAEDRAEATRLLEDQHGRDRLQMPLQAPAFDQKAAEWAAHYLYRALQFLLIRNLEAADMQETLAPYPGPMTAEAIYAADLTLRNLPAVYGLAQSLSPNDPLVLNLLETAARWPFSSIGIAVEAPPPVFDHPSLRIAYIDRVIAAKDRPIARNLHINQGIQAALGAHAKQLWPDFDPIHPTTTAQ